MLSFNQCLAAKQNVYSTFGDCDGFPKTDLKATPGTCVGVISEELGFPRGVAAIGSDIYVIDMGGWRVGHGRLLRLANNGHSKPEVLLSKLDEPNAIIPGLRGSLYISSLGRIFLFDPKTGNTRDIIVNLPSTGRHPLSALAAAPDGSLFINVGSATDHCEKDNGDPPDPTAPCPETLESPGRGTILHIMPTATPIDARQLHSYASGLRNSMALAVLPSGQLYAAVNSRDAINQADPSLSDEELPHDTLDRIEQGDDYGWPYCFDSNRPSPEYSNFDCTAKHLPNSLLPAHAAPAGHAVLQRRTVDGLRRSSDHRLSWLSRKWSSAGKSRP